MSTEPYDFIIVGGGTAGSVLASRLSEDSNLRILVLEAGEDQRADPRVLTPAIWPSLIGTPSDWAFQTVPQQELGNRIIKCPQGRLLGGSSAVNGLAFTATSRSNVDAWEKLGNPGWDWPTFSQFSKKSFTVGKPSDAAIAGLGLEHLDFTEEDHDAPLHLSFPEQPENQWPKTWRETLKSLDLATTGDPFSGTFNGACVNPESIHPTSRTRSYAANAYLEPAMARANVTVLTGANVEQIIFDNSDPSDIRAQAVRYTKGGETFTAATRKEIVLTAGTFNSPKLLELSGIGDATRLKKHGIPVVVDNPFVGENLQNHVMCGLSYEVNDDCQTMDSLSRQDPSTISAAMEAYSKQAGPFASGGTFCSAQLPFRAIEATTAGHQNFEGLLASAVSDGTPFGDAHKTYVHSVLSSPTEASGCLISFPGFAGVNPDGSMAPPPQGTEKYFTVIAILCHPLSRGSVHLSPGQAHSDLAIDPKYLSNTLDIEVLSRYMHYIDNKIVRANPLASLLKDGGKRNPDAPARIDSLEIAKDYIHRTAVGAHHFTGTCSMMPRASGGVVDAKLRVYGCSNLRVCDASIIPFTPRTNPQATVYALAERGADLIKQI